MVLLLMPNKHFLAKFWKCQNAVSILPHEAEALLEVCCFNQSYLAKSKIVSVVFCLMRQNKNTVLQSNNYNSDLP